MAKHKKRRYTGSGAHSASASARTRARANEDTNEITITLDAKGLGLLLVGALVALVMLAWQVGWLQPPSAPEIDANAGLWLILVTGLTAGGLSCLAVQGGLLATTIAQREQALLEREATTRDHVLPILLFLAAKLVAYTTLGALLGAVGSFLSLSPITRGVLQVAVGVFMVITALQLLDVHPFFRRFALQPPKAVQRTIRRQSKRSDWLGPLTLGALTVFIPCGVTQAMELVAMGTGDPLKGAAILFAYTLGTIPLFFLLGIMATRLSAAWQQGFRLVTSTVILLLAVTAIWGGVRLMGFVPASALASTSTAPAAASLPAVPASGVQEQVIEVQPDGYTPNRFQLKAGMPARLTLVSNGVQSCARAFTIPALGLMRVLPVTGQETIDLPPLQPGQMAFMCSMGMYGGLIEVIP